MDQTLENKNKAIVSSSWENQLLPLPAVPRSQATRVAGLFRCAMSIKSARP